MKTIYDDEVVQYRMKYVLEVKHGDKSISKAADDAGITWKTMKSWVVWYDNEGIHGLLNKPRGSAQPMVDETKKLIIEIKIENRHRSTRKIRDLLRKNEEIQIHRQTIWRILKEAGENKRAKRKNKLYRDFERTRPNALWQIDFMDAIIIEDVGLTYLILIVDDH